MSKKHLTVKLECGLRLPWAVPPDNGRLMGTVRQGQAFGYLVLMPNGAYVQVNGAVVRSLSAFRVRQAMRNAMRGLDASEAIVDARNKAQLAKPVVIVRKKRRTIELDALPKFSQQPQSALSA